MDNLDNTITSPPKNKGGRPKKKIIIPFELDQSMSVEEADAQKKIASAKDTIYKAQISKIKAEKEARTVLETTAVINLVTDVFTKLKTILYSSTNKLPAQITGKEHAEVTQILFKFIDDSLSAMMADFDRKLQDINIDDTQEEDSEDE